MKAGDSLNYYGTIRASGVFVPLKILRRFFAAGQRPKERHLMSPEYIGGRRSDRLPTVISIWLEGRSPLPSINLIAALEASFNIVFDLFGIGRNATPSEIIINKLRTDRFQSVTILNKLSGKALTVEDSSTNQGASIQQVTRNGAANQRWFVKRTKFIKHRIIPQIVDREVLPWPTVLRFSHAVYSVTADHSGLCLDILNGSTDNSAAVQQLPVHGGNNQLWAFVPDRQGFNVILNVHSGQVLDVTDNSLENYATVQQRPFNGGDNQRWQLIN
jgi:hypothetical protein